MGKPLSTLVSYAIRPIKNYNVRSRAHKLIDSDIPRVAPKHPSTMRVIEELVRDNPQVKEELERKDEKLLQRLKDVYVTVTAQQIEAPSETQSQTNASSKTRPLPSSQPYFASGREEQAAPKPTSIGKISLMNTIKLLTDYQDRDEKDVPMKEVAEEYRLDPEIVRNILRYYSTLQLHMPQDASKQDADARKWLPSFALPIRALIEGSKSSSHKAEVSDSETSEVSDPEKSKETPKPKKD